jgi:hypothetical protein
MTDISGCFDRIVAPVILSIVTDSVSALLVYCPWVWFGEYPWPWCPRRKKVNHHGFRIFSTISLPLSFQVLVSV